MARAGAARRAAAAALALALPAQTSIATARGGDGPRPKPLDPLRVVKPAEGFFDEAFALDAAGARLAAVRTDGATFAKLELVDIATGAITASFDLPARMPPVDRIEVLPDPLGFLLVAEERPGRSVAFRIDATGQVAAKAEPATAFGSPPRGPALVAFDRKTSGRKTSGQDDENAVVSYTVTPLELATLAPAGKARTYPAGPLRVLGFYDGYTRAIGELPGSPARMAVLDTLTGKVTEEDPIVDDLAWVRAARVRAEHPGRGRFAALNQGEGGVDIVDAMGNRRLAELAIPFGLYDPKSLRDQEGPERGVLYFSLAVDPLNAAAIKRRKPDLPMLDVYSAPEPGKGPVRLRGRVFTPRPVTWRAGRGKLVVLKRLKKAARGGDELQVYDLR